MRGTGSNNLPPHRSPSLGQTEGRGRTPEGSTSLGARLRHLPLFWKLTLAQLALLGAVGFGLAAVLEAPGASATGPALWLVAIGGVVAAGGVSAWLTRVALSPLEAIEQTADRVRAGDYEARAPSSPLADHRLDRVGVILNEMLDALDRARRRQRQLSLQVLRSQERERGRMSGDLYDRTAQTLAGVLIRLNLLSREDSDTPRAESLAFVTEQIRDALEEVRMVARRLRPPELNDLGVRYALEALGRELDEEHELMVCLEGDLPESRLTEDARLALFRIVQEALLNVARHARARRALVTFIPKPGEVLVEVQDDGVGFEPTDLGGEGDPRLGLVTMIERAGYARGRITVESSPGLGTRVRLVFPLDEERTPAEDVPEEVPADRVLAGLLTADSNSAQGGPDVQ
jgi:signal transduction histidine kinase